MITLQAVSSSSTCNDTSAPMTLNQLPTEILLEILRRIPPLYFSKSLRALSCTCVKFFELRREYIRHLAAKWTDTPYKFMTLIKKTSLDPLTLLNLCEHFQNDRLNISDIRFGLPDDIRLLVDEATLTEKEKKQLGMILGVVNTVKEIFQAKSPVYRTAVWSKFPACSSSRSGLGLMHVLEPIETNYLNASKRSGDYKLVLPILCEFEKHVLSEIDKRNISSTFQLLQFLIRTKQFSLLKKIQEKKVIANLHPIHWAAICGSVEEINALKSEVNTVYDWPPLFYAAMRGDPIIVKTLLSLRANYQLNLRMRVFFSYESFLAPKVFCNPLTIAVMCGNTKAALEIHDHQNSDYEFFNPDNILINWYCHGNDVFATQRIAIPPFIYALWNNDLQLVRAALNTPDMNLSPLTCLSIMRSAVAVRCTAEMLSIVVAGIFRQSGWLNDQTRELDLHKVMNYAIEIDAEDCVDLLLYYRCSPNKISLASTRKNLLSHFFSPPPLVTPYSLIKNARIKALMAKQGGTHAGLIAIKVSYIAMIVLSWSYSPSVGGLFLAMHCIVAATTARMITNEKRIKIPIEMRWD